ncbi:MAG: hypothetical protein HY040_16045 [Planctomycetes bacterium]|nr:hypothetical protein [Planctomycetota bacterium]
MWLVYAVLAGLCWGTYVPFIQQGIRGLSGNSLGSFLCVGVAYFLIAILYPVAMFMMEEGNRPSWTGYGITFATLAGAAGALGALCVILANRGAGDNRLYIAPIIFALAPVLNTLISLVWHASPVKGAFHFGFVMPDWKLFLGVVLTGIGAALVLYSKEETEKAAKGTSQKAAAAVAPSQR